MVLRVALERVDLCEGVFEGGVAVAFAGVGGVEGLFLCGESGGEAELIVVSGEPGVEDERGEEECGAEGGDFDCAAGGEGESHVRDRSRELAERVVPCWLGLVKLVRMLLR